MPHGQLPIQIWPAALCALPEGRGPAADAQLLPCQLCPIALANAPCLHALCRDPSGCQPSRRPAHRHHQTSSSPFVTMPQRRYLIQQLQYALVRALPTVCWNDSPRNPVPSVHNSQMVCCSGTVKTAPLGCRLTRGRDLGRSSVPTCPGSQLRTAPKGTRYWCR